MNIKIENRWIEMPFLNLPSAGRFFERHSRIIIDNEVRTDWTRICVETAAIMRINKQAQGED